MAAMAAVAAARMRPLQPALGLPEIETSSVPPPIDLLEARRTAEWGYGTPRLPLSVRFAIFITGAMK
jgi:hypothetical protein